MKSNKRKIIRISVLVTILFLSFWIFFLREQPSAQNINNEWSVLLNNREFSCLLENDGWIYAGGANGLYRIEIGSKKTEEVKVKDKSLSMVRALYVDDSNRLWVGYENGLAILGEPVITLKLEDGLLNTKILDLLPLEKGAVMASTFDGLAMIKNDLVSQFIKEAPYLPGPTIKSLYKDSQGFVWYGAFSNIGGGIAVKKDDHIQTFSVANGLVHDNITSIVETEKKTILVGAGLHTKGGANELEWRNNKWEIVGTYTKSDGLAGEKVRHIFIDHGKYYWFCSEYDGVAILKDMKRVMLLNTESGLSHDEVKRIIRDSNGDYWLATKSGITVIPKMWIEENLKNNQVS